MSGEEGDASPDAKTVKRRNDRGADARGAQQKTTNALGAAVGRRGSRAATGQPGTNRPQILAILKRPAGAPLNAIIVATGWQAHSVRGFISGHLVKKMKLRVKSFRQGGERVYTVKS